MTAYEFQADFRSRCPKGHWKKIKTDEQFWSYAAELVGKMKNKIIKQRSDYDSLAQTNIKLQNCISILIMFDEYSYDIDENTLTFFYEGNISALFKLEFLVCFIVDLEEEPKSIVL